MDGEPSTTFLSHSTLSRPCSTQDYRYYHHCQNNFPYYYYYYYYLHHYYNPLIRFSY